MKFLSTLVGAAALTLMASSAFAVDLKMMDGVMVDINDMTVYTYDKDEAGVSNCYDKCAVNWPPVAAVDGDMADGDFTIVERTDGSKQWAYKGMPLYLWIKDANPGDKTGDGVGGVWHVVTE